jgi:hypothetical protein
MDGHITSISLSENHLAGTLASGLGSRTKLTYLSLRWNSMKGQQRGGGGVYQALSPKAWG